MIAGDEPEKKPGRWMRHEDWKKAHPKARDGAGPYPWRTEVTVRRNGAVVPQTLVVKFSDGSSETVRQQQRHR